MKEEKLKSLENETHDKPVQQVSSELSWILSSAGTTFDQRKEILNGTFFCDKAIHVLLDDVAPSYESGGHQGVFRRAAIKVLRGSLGKLTSTLLSQSPRQLTVVTVPWQLH